ncbi:hypothetical protein ASPTUDRAFT_37522 [Aspergillus tubingensis CBS 134.48]|uniref:Uncharacterized protein n=1 Tax=Aspergillus tubingensis (strain CBS 134.48) TaxID=767770 RepID=A0A1L9NNE6_ASPTC|nr:hypothetical protein ASPTUDRAFT_37522 [Aspergillus tubingensis CBS 134.48]
MVGCVDCHGSLWGVDKRVSQSQDSEGSTLITSWPHEPQFCLMCHATPYIDELRGLSYPLISLGGPLEHHEAVPWEW